MTNTWRRATVVLMSVAAMMVAVRANAGDERAVAPGLRDATIVLHVTNYARVSDEILAVAKARVATVYEHIGVRIVWVDDEVSLEERQDGQLHLSILLLSREMTQKAMTADDVSNNVLGRAHVAGARAQIFCDRIATTPGALTYFPILLGNIISHEIGHLLLGPNSHSRSGIMRAHADVRALHIQSFEKTQADTIRMRLMALPTRSTRR